MQAQRHSLGRWHGTGFLIAAVGVVVLFYLHNDSRGRGQRGSPTVGIPLPPRSFGIMGLGRDYQQNL